VQTQTLDGQQVKEEFSLCVFGTSNGVVKNGYADYLKNSDKINVFKNYSLGASTSSFVFYYDEKVNFSDYGFCVVDLCVNDGRWIDSGHVSVDTWTQVLLDFCSRILAAGSIPILLVLPSPNLLATPPVVQARAHDISRTLNIPILDGYELLHKAMESKPGTQPDGFFRDPVHVHEWFGQEMSRLIVENLPRLRSQRLDVPKTKTITLARHQLVKLTHQAGKDVQVRGTSLLREEFTLLTQKDGQVQFTVPDGSTAIALCLDQRPSNGTAEISGTTTYIQNLTNIYYFPAWDKPNAGMLFSFRPLQKEILADGEHISLRVLPHNPGAPVSKQQEGRPTQVMLHGLIVRSEPQPVEVHDIFSGETQIMRWVDPANFSRMAEISTTDVAARIETRQMEH
jgi:hypothetical protein